MCDHPTLNRSAQVGQDAGFCRDSRHEVVTPTKEQRDCLMFIRVIIYIMCIYIYICICRERERDTEPLGPEAQRRARSDDSAQES